jgi:hypothetical protein
MISVPSTLALLFSLAAPIAVPSAAPCDPSEGGSWALGRVADELAGAGVRSGWHQAATDPLREVYEAGISWSAFLDGVQANQRRVLWDRNWETSRVPDDLLARALAVGGGPWRILAITDPACSDSVNTVPYLAYLAEAVPSMEIRVVSALQGRPWMEAHRSPDGRASTPTILLLDNEYTLRGCWIEQPREMAAFWLDVVARGTMTAEVGRKLAWYEEDRGRSTLREFVEVLEAAQTESPICPGLAG